MNRVINESVLAVGTLICSTALMVGCTAGNKQMMEEGAPGVANYGTMGGEDGHEPIERERSAGCCWLLTCCCSSDTGEGEDGYKRIPDDGKEGGVVTVAPTKGENDDPTPANIALQVVPPPAEEKEGNVEDKGLSEQPASAPPSEQGANRLATPARKSSEASSGSISQTRSPGEGYTSDAGSTTSEGSTGKIVMREVYTETRGQVEEVELSD